MRNKKGILLLEVVVALIILTTGLVVVSRSLASCLRALESVTDYNTAVMLADEVFLGLEVKDPNDWAEGGSFEEYPNFSWTLESEDDDELNLKRIKLDIGWKSRGRDYNLPLYLIVRKDEET